MLNIQKREKQTKVVEGLQIFELLQLSRQEEEMRHFCMASLRQLGQWKKTMSYTIHPLVMGKMRIQGNILRRKARQSVALYKCARHERIANFECYINTLPRTQGIKRLVS